MSRPKWLLGVLGTHTEVGKTWVGMQLLLAARQRGLRVAARKPVQSFAPDGSATDAEQLSAATGERAEQVCAAARCYQLAMAPPMAADRLNKPHIIAAELLAELSWPPDIDLGLVESVGGPRSPMTHDADSVEFIECVQPDCLLLVADAGLGSLNAIRLSLSCLPALPVHVMLNRFDARDPLHELNRAWLAERYGIRAYANVGELLDAIIAGSTRPQR
jgi:dethiobiotin synthetase